METTPFEKEECSNTGISNETKYLWEVELQVLQVFQEICARHNLTYFAAGGTLLGAVRHRGFIPWDDDIDVQMPREDYDKFIRYAGEELSYPYFLQSYQTEKLFRPYHCKIRKLDSPAYTVKEKQANPKTTEGIWIDVFCLDYVPDGKLRYFLKIFWLKFIRRLITGEGIVRRLHRKKGTKKLRAMLSISGIMWRFVRHFTTLKHLCAYYDRFAVSKEKTGRLAATCFKPGSAVLTWDAKLFNDAVDLPFENTAIKAPAEYEKVLTTQYGNWKVPVIGTQYHSSIVIGPYVKKRNR